MPTFVSTITPNWNFRPQRRTSEVNELCARSATRNEIKSPNRAPGNTDIILILSFYSFPIIFVRFAHRNTFIKISGPSTAQRNRANQNGQEWRTCGFTNVGPGFRDFHGTARAVSSNDVRRDQKDLSNATYSYTGTIRVVDYSAVRPIVFAFFVFFRFFPPYEYACFHDDSRLPLCRPGPSPGPP